MGQKVLPSFKPGVLNNSYLNSNVGYFLENTESIFENKERPSILVRPLESELTKKIAEFHEFLQRPNTGLFLVYDSDSNSGEFISINHDEFNLNYDVTKAAAEFKEVEKIVSKIQNGELNIYSIPIKLFPITARKAS